jgi:hypothetical protein
VSRSLAVTPNLEYGYCSVESTLEQGTDRIPMPGEAEMSDLDCAHENVRSADPYRGERGGKENLPC